MVLMPLDDSLEKKEEHKPGEGVESHPSGIETGCQRRRLEVEQCATEQRSCGKRNQRGDQTLHGPGGQEKGQGTAQCDDRHDEACGKHMREQRHNLPWD